jgi:hypothetical protein
MQVVESSGDGISTDLIRITISLPNRAGSQDTMIQGYVQKVGNALVTVSGSPIALPAAPASGSVYYIVQIDWTSGTATSGQASVKVSNSGYPSPDAGNIQVFAQTLTAANPNPGSDMTLSTPD